MKSALLCAAAIAAIATPAAARDRSAYFGLEIGPMWVMDSEVEEDGVQALDITHKLGVDGDLILGYDFGMVRAELEGAHKWAKHDEYEFPNGPSVEGDGHSRAYSIMGNALLDFGRDDSANFYVGGGAGIAWVRQTFDSPADGEDIKDSGLAWQLIAGVRYPMWTHFDLGVKYRYFNAGDLEDEIDGDRLESEFQSHSLLVSLIYNFNAPVVAAPPPPPLPPPPPPPAPPATQTCPDGTVVLATEPCPMPPPPPPPPPPAPERG